MTTLSLAGGIQAINSGISQAREMTAVMQQTITAVAPADGAAAVAGAAVAGGDRGQAMAGMGIGGGFDGMA